MKITIFGANEMGCLIATEFFEDHDITVIDREENRTEEFDKLDISFVYGNGSNIKVLEAAQIKDADIFIACTNMDEANIVACLTVKKMSRACCVCFIRQPEYIESLSIMKGSQYQPSLAIDNIIWPEELLTMEIFRILTVPSAIDVEYFVHGKARMLEYRINENSTILNKKVKDCRFPQETLIVGITKNATLMIPDGETVLELNDKVIFMGSSKSLDILAGIIFKEKDKIKTVTVIGGGNVGLMLAQQLENVGIKAKIIEKDFKRCQYLIEVLKKTMVINGDGTDLSLLQEESIADSDVVVSVTDNDEKNLLCSLLSKQLGVKKVITRVSKATNIGLFEKVGIDVAISPRGAAIREIKNDFIDTELKILATVEQGQGEVLEIVVNESFDGRLVMDLKLPVKAIIAIIQRGSQVIIPKGDTRVKSGDELILFTMQENLSGLKDYFG